MTFSLNATYAANTIVFGPVAYSQAASVDFSAYTAGFGDFNGDGKTDMILYNHQGPNWQTLVRLATGTGELGPVVYGSVSSIDFSAYTAGFGDFNRGPGEFPGEFVGNGIFVVGIGGKHNKTDAEVTNTVFVFAINGIRIAHFASLGQAPSEEMWAKLNELGGIDVLLIQAYTDPTWKSMKMTLEECCSVVDRLDPRIVIPEHGNIGISEHIAQHYHTQVRHEGYGGFVVTKGLLRSINGHRILDMDTTSRRQ